MTTLPIDTKAGIAARLSAYDDFYALCEERAAHRNAGGELREFVVFGTVWLGDGGSTHRITVHGDANALRARLPAVMTMDEYVEAMTRDGVDFRISMLNGNQLSDPFPPGTKCASCGEGWTMDNCHDFVCEMEFEEILSVPDECIGLTLTEYAAKLNADAGGKASYGVRTCVRNDAWKEAPRRPWDEGGRVDGWRSEDDDDVEVTMDYVLRRGDDVAASVTRYRHGACHAALEAEREAEQSVALDASLSALFTDCGFTGVVLNAVPAPQHLIETFLSDDEEGDGDEEETRAMLQELRYLRIETDQGGFGFFQLAYPVLDLTDCGVSLAELLGDEMPPELEGATGAQLLTLSDPALVTRLRVCMGNAVPEKG